MDLNKTKTTHMEIRCRAQSSVYNSPQLVAKKVRSGTCNMLRTWLQLVVFWLQVACNLSWPTGFPFACRPRLHILSSSLPSSSSLSLIKPKTKSAAQLITHPRAVHMCNNSCKIKRAKSGKNIQRNCGARFEYWKRFYGFDRHKLDFGTRFVCKISNRIIKYPNFGGSKVIETIYNFGCLGVRVHLATYNTCG